MIKNCIILVMFVASCCIAGTSEKVEVFEDVIEQCGVLLTSSNEDCPLNEISDEYRDLLIRLINSRDSEGSDKENIQDEVIGALEKASEEDIFAINMIVSVYYCLYRTVEIVDMYFLKYNSAPSVLFSVAECVESLSEDERFRWSMISKELIEGERNLSVSYYTYIILSKTHKGSSLSDFLVLQPFLNNEFFRSFSSEQEVQNEVVEEKYQGYGTLMEWYVNDVIIPAGLTKEFDLEIQHRMLYLKKLSETCK